MREWTDETFPDVLKDAGVLEPSLAEERYKVAAAMIETAGSFFRNLGIALRKADRANTLKIKETWSDEWEHYLDVFDEELTGEKGENGMERTTKRR